MTRHLPILNLFLTILFCLTTASKCCWDIDEEKVPLVRAEAKQKARAEEEQEEKQKKEEAAQSEDNPVQALAQRQDLAFQTAPSPNFGERRYKSTPREPSSNRTGPLCKRPHILMLHATVGTAGGTIGLFGDLKNDVSAHYLVHKNGTITQFNRPDGTPGERLRAFHAGYGAWRKQEVPGRVEEVNVDSIGIEIENYGHPGEGISKTVSERGNVEMKSDSQHIQIQKVESDALEHQLLEDVPGWCLCRARDSEDPWYVGRTLAFEGGLYRYQRFLRSGSVLHSYLQPSQGHPLLWHLYTRQQVDTVGLLCQDIVRRYGILPHNVIAHSDMAVNKKTGRMGRKVDPGPTFPWAYLHQRYGVGAWPTVEAPLTTVQLPEDDLAARTEWVRQRLLQYGYPAPDNAEDNDGIQRAVRSFQMHFRAGNISGEIDDETIQILARLVDRYTEAEEEEKEEEKKN